MTHDEARPVLPAVFTGRTDRVPGAPTSTVPPDDADDERLRRWTRFVALVTVFVLVATLLAVQCLTPAVPS